MTREEAIRWLKVINTKKFGWDEFALQESQREIRERCEQGVREAIDMAIESLSAETEWIPCSERLPEEDTDVLISYRYIEDESDTNHVYIYIASYGDMYFGGRKVEGVKHWRPPFEYFSSNYEVIAWMPLPKPYEERREP